MRPYALEDYETGYSLTQRSLQIFAAESLKMYPISACERGKQESQEYMLEHVFNVEASPSHKEIKIKSGLDWARPSCALQLQ